MIANSTNRNYSENNTCTPATSKGDLIPKKINKKKKKERKTAGATNSFSYIVLSYFFIA